jgi:hypothetical protein
MSRSDALSLAAALHESGFNLLIYGQRGSSSPPRGASTLGLIETEEMLCALAYLQDRPESNRALIGIWGVDVGAFAALRAAGSINEVRAIAADGAFGTASDFLDLMIKENFGIDNKFLRFGCRQVFGLFNLSSILSIDERFPLRALTDRSILFIKGENRAGLGHLTAALYDEVPGQKKMLLSKTSRVHLMSGEELKSYDGQVAGFFQQNLQ